ncbi:MAG: hypothetical protein V7717_04650 [Porticoccaceae bacterium]
MKKPYLSISTVIVTAVLMLFASMSTLAEDEKAFAEHKFVLQMSDMDAAKQTLVLNVATNITARTKRM